MKVSILMALLLIGFQSCAKNNQTHYPIMKAEQHKNNDREDILALTRRFTQLMIDRNTAELAQMVDENFTLTHITGRVQSKADWFAEIEAESMKYFSAKEVEHSLKINGDTAEFVQKNLLDARIWGMRNTWRLQQTMTLEKRNGKWIILKSVARTF